MCFLDCQSMRDVLTKVARHPPLLQQPRHMPTLAVGLQQAERKKLPQYSSCTSYPCITLNCSTRSSYHNSRVAPIFSLHSLHARSQHDQCANATEFLDNYRKTEKIELYQKLSKAYATLVGGKCQWHCHTTYLRLPNVTPCILLHTMPSYAYRLPLKPLTCLQARGKQHFGNLLTEEKGRNTLCGGKGD